MDSAELIKLLLGALWALTLWVVKRNTDAVKDLSDYIHTSELKNEKRFGELETQILLQSQICRDHVAKGHCPEDCPLAKELA